MRVWEEVEYNIYAYISSASFMKEPLHGRGVERGRRGATETHPKLNSRSTNGSTPLVRTSEKRATKRRSTFSGNGWLESATESPIDCLFLTRDGTS